MGKKVKCPKCGTIFSTKFCPDCGMKYEDVEKPELPTTITMYIHGDKENGYGIVEKLGIDENSKLGEQIMYAGYEVKLVFKIDGEKLLLHQVDAGDGQGLLDVIKNNSI